MIVINRGDKPYTITLGMGAKFQVCAQSESEALDIMADYLVEHKYGDLYYDRTTIEVMAECSEYKTAEALAKAHNLTCCGSNHIYIEVEELKCSEN